MKFEKLAGTYNRIYTYTVCSLLSLLNILQTVAKTVSLSLPHIFCNSGQLRLNDRIMKAWKPRFICTRVLIQKKGTVFSQHHIFVSGNLQLIMSFQLSFTLIWHNCTVWKCASRTALLQTHHTAKLLLFCRSQLMCW